MSMYMSNMVQLICIIIVVANCSDVQLESILSRMDLIENRNTQLNLEVVNLKTMNTHLEQEVVNHKNRENVLSEKLSRLEKYVHTKDHNDQGHIKGNRQQKRLLLQEASKSGIAFSTFKSASFQASSFNKGRELVYDKIECNIGNGYDNYTGSFRAPSTGAYGFIWTVCASSPEGEIGVELIVNGKVHGVTYADTATATEEDCATGFVIKYLNTGDVVFTRSGIGAHLGTIRSDAYARTTFSGWLLF